MLHYFWQCCFEKLRVESETMQQEVTDPRCLCRRSLAAPQSTFILAIIPVFCLIRWNGVACWFWPRLMHLDSTDLGGGKKESTLKRRDKAKHHNGTQTTDKLKTTFWMCLKGLLLHRAIRGPLFRRKIKYRVWKPNIEQRFTTRKKRGFFLLPVSLKCQTLRLFHAIIVVSCNCLGCLMHPTVNEKIKVGDILSLLRRQRACASNKG